MFEPIISERQCPKCLQCRPAHDFVPRRSGCIACRRAAARERYHRLYAKPGPLPWATPPEIVALLREHYPHGGSGPCLKRLPAGWSAGRVRRVANAHGIRYVGPPPAAKRERAAEPAWAVPGQNEMERDDCIRLRRWRYPVEAGALNWRIA